MDRRLVQQTEDAIALQDMKLGLLMGKLQADSLKKQEVMAQEEATVIDIRASNSLHSVHYY